MASRPNFRAKYAIRLFFDSVRQIKLAIRQLLNARKYSVSYM